MTDNYDGIPDREPDVVSEHATLADSPDDTIPIWYRVSRQTALRDFPSFQEGKIERNIKQGDLVVGYEVEGKWVRVFKNSYAYLPDLEKIQKK